MESGPPIKRIKLDEQPERESEAVVQTPTIVPVPQSSATHSHRVQETSLSPLRGNLQQGPQPYPDLPGGGPSFTPSHALPPHVQWGHSYHHPTVSQNFITHMHGAGTSGSNMPQRPIVSVHNLSMPLQSVVFTSPLWIGAEQLYNRELVTTTPVLSMSRARPSSSVFQGYYTSSQAINEASTMAHQSHTPGISVMETAGGLSNDQSTEFQAENTGKNAAEYQTIKKCTPKLVTALIHNLTELSSHLLSKELITSDQSRELRNKMHTESDRATNLIDFILNKVELASECYNIFIKALEEDKHGNEAVLKLLREMHKSLTPGGQISTVVISSPNNMTKLNEYLLSNIYKLEGSQTSSDKFPYLPNKKFITLAVIEKEGINRATADMFTKGTLHGHADEILKKKRSIDLEAVLEPPESQQDMKCVFVEGAPGVGKSTFALELCRRQKEIKSMKKYSLIILLRLREREIQNIQNTGMVFENICHNEILQQYVSKEVTANDGKNVLFILDGFDELPTNLRKDSYFTKLIRGTHLPACTVLVTSRPSASTDILHCIKQYKHIEVLGFTEEKIKQYAKSMLSDQPDILEGFLKYISENLPIRGMMYIPLNSAIVLQIYKMNRMSTGKHIPRTMTELYTELCLTLLRKNLEERNHPLANQVSCDTALEDLPKCIKDQVILLGELAFEGALKQEINFIKLPSGCDDLGFMNVSTGLYLGRKSYSFLHLTLQEFLAAYYFSQLTPDEQISKFIRNSSLMTDDKCGEKEYLDVMWKFVAGLTGFKDVGWRLVYKAINARNEFHANQFIIHCLYEVQNEKEIKAACDHLFHEKIPEVTVTTLLHSYLAGYCIAVSGCSWNFDASSIREDDVIEMLGHGLKSASDICGSISSLNLAVSELTERAISHLSDLPIKILGQIKHINLFFNKLDKSAFDQLSNVVPHLVNLDTLSLVHNPGGDGAMVRLFPKLTQLRLLNISEIILGPSDVQALSQLLQSTKCLMELKIGDPYMSEESVSLMVEVLLSPSSLYRVILSSIQWTTKNVANFALLENNKNIAVLHFEVFNEDFEDDPRSLNLVIPAIAKALHKNDTLVHLGVPSCEKPHIHYFDIEHESVVALSEMLEVNKTLKHLDVFTFLTCHDIQVLVNALEENYTLEQLHLQNERIQISNSDLDD